MAGYAHASNKRAMNSWAIRTAINMSYFAPDVVDKPKWDFQFALASVWPYVRQFALEGGINDEWPNVKPLELTGEKFILGPKVLLQATGHWKGIVPSVETYEESRIESVRKWIVDLLHY